VKGSQLSLDERHLPALRSDRSFHRICSLCEDRKARGYIAAARPEASATQRRWESGYCGKCGQRFYWVPEGFRP